MNSLFRVLNSAQWKKKDKSTQDYIRNVSNCPQKGERLHLEGKS